MLKEYSNFADLCSSRSRGIDFDTSYEDRKSTWAVIAPHGGKIEPHTGKIAKIIAQKSISFYVFTSKTKFQDGYTDHLMSTNFDDPNALKIVASAQWVLAIHGRHDRKTPDMIWVGGLYEEKRQKIIKKLNSKGFKACEYLSEHGGISKNNICNKGRLGKGVQLEIPRTLRSKLSTDKSLMTRFVEAFHEFDEG